MILRRMYPGLGFFSVVCFVLFVVGFVLLISSFSSDNVVSRIVLATLTISMAVLGGTLWVTKTVLEVAFHLRESFEEASKQIARAGESEK